VTSIRGLKPEFEAVKTAAQDALFDGLGPAFANFGQVVLPGVTSNLAVVSDSINSVAKDMLGTLVCVGVLAMLLFQVFENMGMTMGIMPITGIPLPFMSYGGSSTIMMFAAMGLVLNVHTRRFS
jgi:rod shape determining protein RodA